jgi:hypothetical protein
VRPGAGVEPVVGRLELELGEEDCRELGVVVLARVHDDLLHPALAQREREWGRLHELRSVADDGKDSHAAGESSRTQ